MHIRIPYWACTRMHLGDARNRHTKIQRVHVVIFDRHHDCAAYVCTRIALRALGRGHKVLNKKSASQGYQDFVLEPWWRDALRAMRLVMIYCEQAACAIMVSNYLGLKGATTYGLFWRLCA